MCETRHTHSLMKYPMCVHVSLVPNRWSIGQRVVTARMYPVQVIFSVKCCRKFWLLTLLLLREKYNQRKVLMDVTVREEIVKDSIK
jgi:hypothetical protein